jgi:hypothetical protein
VPIHIRLSVSNKGTSNAYDKQINEFLSNAQTLVKMTLALTEFTKENTENPDDVQGNLQIWL